MGPFGTPSGGQSFDYNGHGSIKSLIVRCGIIVDSIEVIFKKEDYLFSKRAGVGGGEYHEVICIIWIYIHHKVHKDGVLEIDLSQSYIN